MVLAPYYCTNSMGGEKRPISYVSRLLSKAEKNYLTCEQEGLAIVWAVKKFRAYLGNFRFRVLADHRALNNLETSTSYGLIDGSLIAQAPDGPMGVRPERITGALRHSLAGAA